ncbi:MAG: beta-ketoacyl-ACP synthase II, partial [Deltaproteobacteria bacterium]|nr:beta-ketoacyl-ACP synthase II [Deltaproteobacteria bacterium]
MPSVKAERRRVVITGLGCVSPLGVDADSTWQGAIEGRSGIRTITRFDASELPVQFAGEIPGDVNAGDIAAKELRRLDDFILYALAAAREAMEDSGLTLEGAAGDRAGTAIGSGIGGLSTLHENSKAYLKSGAKRVSPFMIPMAIANLAGGYVSIQHGLRGPNICHVSACATGAHSIGEAARIIERGDADVMVVGGTESPVNVMGIAGFAAMRALSTRNDEPGKASRPFDADRDGFVMGEGAGVRALEGLEEAQARGAKIYAEVVGYGASADAQYVALPAANGEGGRRAMSLALDDAGIDPSEIGYLNAHGTSTPAGDGLECGAIRKLFGSHLDQLSVSSTKSMTGHLLGAAGAI